jgi:hypothetical protein
MPLVKPATFNMNHIARDMNPGDILDLSENPLIVVNSAVGVTLTPAQLLGQDIDRTGAAAGAIADTLPSADQIVNFLAGNKNLVTPPGNALYGTEPNKSVQLQWPAMLGVIPPYSTLRRFIRNGVGQVLTVQAAANSGVTVSGTATIAASKWREFLIRILNSTPAAMLSVTTTNASAALSAVDLNLVNQITAGMSVYGTGIAANAVVVGVNRDAGTITMDQAATASGSLIAITFTPTVTLQNLRAGDI